MSFAEGLDGYSDPYTHIANHGFNPKYCMHYSDQREDLPKSKEHFNISDVRSNPYVGANKF